MSTAVADPAVEAPVRERVRTALEAGGRATVTVTSRATGRHLTVRYSAKVKDPETGRYISRARRDGRVGIHEADTVFADVADSACVMEHEYLGSYSPSGDRWFMPDLSHDERLGHYQWAARRVLRWAFADAESEEVEVFEDTASVDLAATCSRCSKQLTDPISVARMLGPECANQTTGSRHV